MKQRLAKFAWTNGIAGGADRRLKRSASSLSHTLKTAISAEKP